MQQAGVKLPGELFEGPAMARAQPRAPAQRRRGGGALRENARQAQPQRGTGARAQHVAPREIAAIPQHGSNHRT